jgi:hypothetical protein
MFRGRREDALAAITRSERDPRYQKPRIGIWDINSGGRFRRDTAAAFCDRLAFKHDVVLGVVGQPKP